MTQTTLQKYVHRLEKESKNAEKFYKKLRKLLEEYNDELPPTFKKEVLTLLGEGDENELQNE